MVQRRRRQSSGGGKSEGAGGMRWMLTYLDMITLLFGVFIVMFSMASVNKAKVQAVAESLRMGFQGGWTIYNQNKSGGVTFQENLNPEGTTSRALFNKFVSILKEEISKRNIHVKEEEGAIIITLLSDLYFNPGSDKINDNAVSALQKIAPVLEEMNFYIRVEGHTDAKQVDENIYIDNWQLASMRAINILRLLIDLGVEPAKLSSTSYGQYKPLFFSNQDTPEKTAIERRVDIVIPTDKAYIYTPQKNNE
jgi:chemotaxis protein MotB